MALAAQLSILESAGLLAVGRTEPELEYLFRHALIQDVAYESLLKTERAQLHRLAGEVLEASYPDRLDELAPRLADHYSQAGELRKAYKYLVKAAESASRRYATTEAIDFYTRALALSIDNPEEQCLLLQARGSLFEAVGDFERSRMDLEAAAQIAHEMGNPKAEWDSLINLGLLWSSRDYHQTGKYYQDALGLARKLGDDRILAHSLNRLGNYLINIGKPQGSLHRHLEALSVFYRLQDETGMAETLDMLGMASAIGGDFFQSSAYLEQAIETFEKTGDRRALSSALNTLAISTLLHITDTTVVTSLTIDEAIRLTNRGLQEAASIGWRPGEAFSYCNLVLSLAARGDYAGSLQAADRGEQIAKEIQHLQWQAFILLGRGVIYHDLFAFDRAQETLEQGLAIARKINSIHWTHSMCATLAMTLLGKGEIDRAVAALTNYLKDDLPARTIGQRMLWCARAEAAQAQGDPRLALEITDKLLETTANSDRGRVPVRVGRVRAEALTALARTADGADQKAELWREAENLLQAVLRESEEKGYRSRVWRIHQDLAQLYFDRGMVEEAEQEQAAMRDVLLDLSQNVPNPGLRRGLLRQARVQVADKER